jgi:hypothetical protein
MQAKIGSARGVLGSAAPILEGDLLIGWSAANSGVVALDAQTGKTVWESVGEKSWRASLKIGRATSVKWTKSWKQASYATPVRQLHGRRQILA